VVTRGGQVRTYSSTSTECNFNEIQILKYFLLLKIKYQHTFHQLFVSKLETFDSDKAGWCIIILGGGGYPIYKQIICEWIEENMLIIPLTFISRVSWQIAHGGQQHVTKQSS